MKNNFKERKKTENNIKNRNKSHFHIMNAGNMVINSKNNNLNTINVINYISNSNLINFFFLFTTGQKYQVSGNTNDLFKIVLNKFIASQCPSYFKDKIKMALFYGDQIDQNKTLSENKIEEGSKVVLSISDSLNTDKDTYNTMIKQPAARVNLSDQSSNVNKILNLDNEDVHLLLNIYDVIQKHKQNIKHKNSLSNIYSCQKNSLECSHIHNKNHEHGLVLLYSNRNWICNICKTKYSNEESTYFCSLCNFDVCNCCIGLIKKYPLKQFYHQQTLLKILEFPFHEHKMIYCRKSKYYNSLSRWSCNKCYKDYSNKIWSFYCTICDYDFCLKCCKKFINNKFLVQKIGIKIDNHPHRLVYMKTNKNCFCNLCKKKYKNKIPIYFCTKCDFGVCKKCMKELSDEKKYPLKDEGEKENYDIKTIKMECHKHPLIYCITSRHEKNATSWICDECEYESYDNEWSFYCSLCEYDLCYDCYTNMK